MACYVSLDSCFGGAREYVTAGLPIGHFLRDVLNMNDDEKGWNDSEDYSAYPPLVRAAARFRDGLVMDNSVYPEFYEDFSNIWADEFKKQSEIVFRHLTAEEVAVSCSAISHVFAGEGLCESGDFQVRLISYHMEYVEGIQSQTYMRAKVLYLLGSDIHSLPKTLPSKEPSSKCKMRYMHSLCVVLYTLVRCKHWLEWKIYRAADLETLADACRRVHSIMTVSIKYNIFDDQQLYKVWINLCKCVKILDEFNDELEDSLQGAFGEKITRFFPKKAHAQYVDHATALKAKYGDWAEKSEAEDEEEDEDEDEGNGQGQGEGEGGHDENQPPVDGQLGRKRADEPAAAAAGGQGKRARRDPA